MDHPAPEPDPAYLHHVEALFAEALDYPPEERTAFLDRACPEAPGVRAEVASLLDALDHSDHFLEAIDPEQATALLEAVGEPVATNQRIGPYQLVREVGRGGMGAVYLAERVDGQFEQEVALKLIKRGMDSEAILRRFLMERQILARLRHDHIARLHDGGITDEGRPYFAMEYIAGVPITAYCDAHRLKVDQRLRLFQHVCGAVQYAHQNLVVHRDLKPSNILVTEAGQVKLLDFGIAKLLDDEAEGGATTLAGMRAMTPEYAAPEQVLGEPVTTATDVYALGVVLYELLTGHRPYQVERQTPDTMARVICEAEPTHPSTAVRRIKEIVQDDGTTETITPEAVSHARNTPPDRLRRQLAGDLDTVVLKALHKEPERRYASAEAFLEDIKRHLAGLPVQARRDTLAYRVTTFVRRHRVGVAIAMAFVTLLAGFAATMAVQQARTARARDKAEAVNHFVVSLFEASNPSIEAKGEVVTARDLLERGEARIDAELEGQPEIKAEMLAVLGNAYHQLGQYERARPLLERALALRQDYFGGEHLDVARSLRDLASLHFAMGDYNDADSLFRATLALRQRLYKGAHADVARTLSDLSVTNRARGDYDKADSLARLALAMRRKLLGNEHPDVAESLNNLGVLLQFKGDYAAAAPMLHEALAIRRTLFGDEHLDVANSMQNLASVVRDQGEYASAEPLLREALAIRRTLLGEVHPEVAESMNMLASLLRRKGDYAVAETLFVETLAMRRTLLGDEHPLVAQSLNNLAVVRRDQGHDADAEPLLREALALWRKHHGAAHPNVAFALQNLGALRQAQGAYAEAESLFRETLAMRSHLLGETHPDVAHTLTSLGDLLVQQRRADEAEPLLRKALAIRQQVLSEDHWRLATTRSVLGACLSALGRYEEAEPLLLSSYEVLRTARGEEDHYTQEALEHIHALYEAWGKPEQAALHHRPLASTPSSK